jgi:hypothetical protein
MTPSPENLKLLGWTQFSGSGKWVSPWPNAQTFDSFEEAWAQAMQNVSVRVPDSRRHGQ